MYHKRRTGNPPNLARKHHQPEVELTARHKRTAVPEDHCPGLHFDYLQVLYRWTQSIRQLWSFLDSYQVAMGVVVPKMLVEDFRNATRAQIQNAAN
jgi:hypothetical protein